MNERPKSLPAGVLCTRHGIVESFHKVHVVVVTQAGKVVASAGKKEWVTVYRSAAKPFQAVPLVEDGVVDTLELTTDELALAAASHNGEPGHLEGVRRILLKVGASEKALGLGPSAPLLSEMAEELCRAGLPVEPIHNNCSGQHAAMLGLARIHDWPLDSYLDPDHPLQLRMLEEMARFTGMAMEEIRTMPDGCGMLAFGLPLHRMALSFARLGAEARGESGPARVLSAMAEHPFMVGGTGRLCTELSRATQGRLIGKLGAEGVYGIAIPSEGLGISVKVEDGGRRAGDAATVRALDLLGLLSPEEGEALDGFRRTEVKNTLGDVVGEIRAAFSFEPGGPFL